jgi:chaperonin GroES
MIRENLIRKVEKEKAGAERARFSITSLQWDYSAKGESIMAKFTPLHDRILVRRVEQDETTRGGIVIPDSAKEKPQEGEVVQVGKGKTTEQGRLSPLNVKEGDRILFGKYSGTEIKLDGEDFVIMREEDVLGILGASRIAAIGVNDPGEPDPKGGKGKRRG